MFADHVDWQLRLLSAKEDWRDDRFAELEAEVEVEGREWVSRWLRGSPSRRVTLRREKSLSRALERSTERLVILEGDPGSGKSVALRHVAQRLARRAAKAHDPRIVPLYVNLKEFRPSSHAIDGAAIRQFIISNVTRVNDREVAQFIEREFDRGLEEGKWLLLLDSFDEIPDVLAATESDAVVEEYADAIYNFLHGMNRSRGVVASRDFRGPRTLELPRFRIMPLTARQQQDLVRRSGLRPESQRLLYQQMAVAEPDLRSMSANPMFLNLVCEHVRASNTFPSNSHSVFETYLARCFSRDAGRIERRYGVGIDLVRRVAEESAFCMAVTPGLGLSPPRKDLCAALARTNRLPLSRLGTALDALEYVKIGRAAEELGMQDGQLFTFAHRRFQEYFATCIVLRDPERVSVSMLLEDGRWRETAVTILLTQSTESLRPMLEAIGEKLSTAVESLQTTLSDAYRWPPGTLYLLGILNAGMGRRAADIPSDLRTAASQILSFAWQHGQRHDRKWAIELAVIAERGTAVDLLGMAFGSGSAILRDAAYQATSRVADPPEELITEIRRALGMMAVNGRLRAERTVVEAEVRRLTDPVSALRTMRLLLPVRLVSWGLLIGIATVVLMFVAYSVPAADLGFFPFFFPVALVLALAVDARVTALILRDAIGRSSMGTLFTIRLCLPMVVVVIGWILAPQVFFDNSSVRWSLELSITLLILTWYWLWPLVVSYAIEKGNVSPALAIVGGPVLLLARLLPRSRDELQTLAHSVRRTLPSLAITALVLGTLVGIVISVRVWEPRWYNAVDKWLNIQANAYNRQYHNDKWENEWFVKDFELAFLVVSSLGLLAALFVWVKLKLNRSRMLSDLRSRTSPLSGADFAAVVKRSV